MDGVTGRAGGVVRRAAEGARVAGALADIDRVAALAGDAGRTDLAGRLAAARARLVADDVAVAVVGEYKQGKSTLVNALLRTEVCPVDADVVTAVPTIVRYGAPPSVVAHPDDGGSPAADVPFARLREYVTGRPHDAGPLRAVEVRLDRRLLRGGLTLVDTPGVGGLDSAQGNLTLGTLALAGAALFVTAADQELTAPELEFLARVRERCTTVICVVTKTDLYGEWRRIVDLDRAHLERAGLPVPVVAVSSFLRLRAGADDRPDGAALNAESGFPRLLAMLRRVVDGADTAAVRAAAGDVTFVLGQLRDQLAAERAAALDPDAGAAMVGTLEERARRGRALASDSATWQRVLNDGIQDLGVEVEHDLRTRLRAMVRRGEALLDAGDPRETWPEFEAWVAREAAAAAVDNLLVLTTRTERLAREVAERFDLEYHGLDLDLPAPAAALARVDALDVRFDRSAVRQFLGAFTAARVAAGGLVVFGALGSLLGFALAPVAAPVAAVTGLVVGRKLMRDERQRQVEYRRQQARQELRRYVDEVAFVVGKDSRDAVRRVQRYLRDEFTARAELAQRSAARALAAVRETTALPRDQRDARAGELERRWRELDRVAGQVTGPPRRATPAGPAARGAASARPPSGQPGRP